MAADYLDVLLRSRRLSPRQVSDVAETVRRGVGSDRSAGRVLGLLWRTQRESLTGPASASVSRAMSSIGSDAETVRLLSDLARDDPSVAVDGRVERVFWRAAATVGSDAQQAGLLRQVLAEEGVDAALLSRALRSARSGVGSDGVMETLLRWTARRFPDLLTEPGPDEAFRAALATIGSDAGRARVTAAARGVLR